MRALQSLGYDAQSLDYDARFIDAIREVAPDAVFIALHGPGGEDGQVQALLEYLGIPYTGSNVEASALAMDKHLTKKLLAAEGLPTPAWDLFDLSGGTLPLLPGSLDLPLVVKPRFEGSSIGVDDRAHARTVDQCHDCGSQELRSNYGRGVSSTGANSRARSSAKKRFRSLKSCSNADEFYTYEAKYAPGGSTHIVPAKIDEDLAARLQMLALSVHRLLGLRDYSRTDFIVTKEGRPQILEINTLPGLTSTSLVPDACASVGISYEALVDRLVGYALARRDVRDVA